MASKIGHAGRAKLERIDPDAQPAHKAGVVDAGLERVGVEIVGRIVGVLGKAAAWAKNCSIEMSPLTRLPAMP
ncbi:MAG: hypothetical protein IPN53_17375 [Comamonadaceae bacterium]|nr:hypothetical protein [Comamonadaceae bacterium]